MLSVVVLTCISVRPVCAAFPIAEADFTNDGRVDLADFAALSSSWMTTLAWVPDGLLPQMLAHWPLEGDGMDSQNMFDGVTNGTATWYVKKDDANEVKVGNGAVGLDGQDYIAIDGSEFPRLYESFTLEAWIKTSSTQQTQTIISHGSNSWQMGVEADTGKIFLSCPGLTGTDYLVGSTFLADGIWHHVAGVYDYDSEQIYLYVDGGIAAQASAAGQVNHNGLDIWLGGDPEAADNWWHGILDNIFLYNYALTLEEVFQRHVWHVDVKNGKDEPNPADPEWGKGRGKPFKTIQHAIDIANSGDMILVWPGIYQESLFFMGKAITVRSAADAAVLEPDPADIDGIAVTFMYGEQTDSILEHFVIVNCNTAIWIHQSDPTLRHLTVVNNQRGVESLLNSTPSVEHCVFWNNSLGDITYDTYLPSVSYSCASGSFGGPGNFNDDPCFANPDSSDPNTMDFHLRSACGRYVPTGAFPQRPRAENWVVDSQTSSGIDAGCPQINPLCESMCNGGIINIGAYGNTPFASKSPWALPADMDHNGCVGVEDLLYFSQQWLDVNAP